MTGPLVVGSDDPVGVLAAVEAAGDRLVLVLPAEGARLVGDPAALADRLSVFDAPVVVGEDGGLPAAGPGPLVAELLRGGTVDAEPDTEHLLFHDVAWPDEPLVPTAAGPVLRWTGEVPLVLMGSADAIDAALAPSDDPDVLALGRLLDPMPTPPPGWWEVAPEILRMPFWSPDRCADLVAAAECYGDWGRDDSDPVPGDEVPLGAISPALFARLEADLEAHVVPRLREQWPLVGWAGVFDAFAIRYGADPDAPDHLPMHHDVAQVSASVRLNDGYEGGTLHFPRQGFANDDAAVGELLAWPSLVTHPHGSEPVRAGVRYGLTIWLRIPVL